MSTHLIKPDWSIFCQVIDNFGDAGVCWRLAKHLAEYHAQTVELIIDRPEILFNLVPELIAADEDWKHPIWPIQIKAWANVTTLSVDVMTQQLGRTVIEAFACPLPPNVIKAMQQMQRNGFAARWLNLEYLSGEAWIEDCHGLSSPQHNGLNKTFFFPGFTQKMGGVLHTDAPKASYIRKPLPVSLGQNVLTQCREEALRIFMFCYQNQGLPILLNHLSKSETPIDILLPPGWPQHQVLTWLNKETWPSETVQYGALRFIPCPFIPQADFDDLLAGCDILFVRGEDSVLRALWSGKPFIWQLYPQENDAHLDKLEGFLNHLNRANPENQNEGSNWQNFWTLWNSHDYSIAQFELSWDQFLKARPIQQHHCEIWRAKLRAIPDLATQLCN